MRKRFLLPLFLTALSGCSETVKTVELPPVLPPDALLIPCPQKYRGPLNVTGDIVTAKNTAEAALAVCAAQIDGVREWKRQSILPAS